ncbi:MAG: phosphoglycerate dehydrogenase [Armatimonadota bacterium]|nr:phosphoglycerate dehydrogenase [Armatimonadota bacterium]
MPTVLVCDPIAEDGLALLEGRAEVVDAAGFDRERLLGAVADADAVVVRSATEVDGELIEAGRRLRVIARAGVGVDNIDVDAATRRGIAVVNTPTGNTIAAAEHSLGMMLALARRIPAAAAALKQGRWAKKQATGRQLYRKTLGIVGLGKIGREVLSRARAFEMTILAHDPYVPDERIRELGAEPVALEELLQRAHVVSLHAALTEQSWHLIGAEELALMQPGALLVNCARGALVDEDALLAALREGRLAGAALDVFESEPEPNRELVSLPNVVATPHVAASTEEAQALVAREAVEQVLEVLAGGRPRWPVNVPALSGEELDRVGPFLPLAESLGVLQAALLSGPPERATLHARGGAVEEHLGIIAGHFLAGLVGAMADEPVNYVNAPVIAAERGLQVSSGAAADARGYSRFMQASVADRQGETTAAGALLDRGQARIVEIAGFGLDLVPQHTVLLVWNSEPDRPGFVGTLGVILGDAGINILGIQVAHEVIDGVGLMAVSVAEPVGHEVRQWIDGLGGVQRLEIVSFDR